MAGGEGATGRVKTAADTGLTLESVVESWKDEFLSQLMLNYEQLTE